MLARTRSALVLGLTSVASIVAAGNAVAQGARIVNENGVQIRETRTMAKRAVVTRQMQPQQRTVFREQVTTENQSTLRTVYTPVTTYRWKAQWHDVLNPFRPAYLRYHLIPKTHWEARTEAVDVPVVRRQFVPVQETVQVPVVTRRFEDYPVVSRTVVGTAPGAAGQGGTIVARRGPAIGGVEKVDNDPPRTGAVNQPGNGTIRH
jgi:hypothetical protein